MIINEASRFEGHTYFKINSILVCLPPRMCGSNAFFRVVLIHVYAYTKKIFRIYKSTVAETRKWKKTFTLAIFRGIPEQLLLYPRSLHLELFVLYSLFCFQIESFSTYYFERTHTLEL